MKITGLKAHVLEAKLSRPFAYSQAWVAARSALVVEITTESGLVGWGATLRRVCRSGQRRWRWVVSQFEI